MRSKFRAVFIVAALAALGYVSATVFSRAPAPSAAGGPPHTFTVTLTDRGFQPETLSIRQGDTVTFVTTGSEAFWPASNPHPTHTMFPAFDPRRAIAPGLSWSFTFTQAGSWGYHDHLAPAFTGVIQVGDARAGSDACTRAPHTVDCWRARLLSTVAEHGTKAALAELGSLYHSEPSFSGSCHTLAHDIGVASWQNYRTDPDSILTPDAAACGNGFYHGFMEAFLTATRDPAKAKAFCSYIGAKLGSEAPDAELQCYHGIGHGAMDFAIGSATLSAASTTAEGLIDPALALCRSVSSSGDELYRCTSAVFNSLANLYLSTTTRSEFGLSVDPEDPLKICREYPQYEDSCNGNMNSLLYQTSKQHLAKALPAIEAIEDDTLARSAMIYLAALSVTGDSGANPSGAVAVCDSAQARLRSSCIRGLAHGFLENGAPGKEGDEALAFCALPALSGPQSSTCYQYVLSSLLGWFSPEESRRLCGSAPAAYRGFCPSSLTK